MPSVIGIDPGAQGAAAVHSGGKLMSIARFAKLTTSELRDWLQEHDYVRVAYVEKVGAMPKQGLSSTFNFGCEYGRILGLLEGLHIPIKEVTPQKWQKGLGLPPKKDGANKHKQALKQLASQRYPGMGKLTNDMPDAMLIAEYAWREEYIAGQIGS